MELRILQIIDDDDQQEPEERPELHSIELLLDYFIHEISCRNNFEFVQAVIRLFLKVIVFDNLSRGSISNTRLFCPSGMTNDKIWLSL